MDWIVLSKHKQKVVQKDRLNLITFSFRVEIAASASSLVEKETKPYPADCPEGVLNITLAETGLKAEKNSLR